jgi:hypothetical protein
MCTEDVSLSSILGVLSDKEVSQLEEKEPERCLTGIRTCHDNGRHLA